MPRTAAKVEDFRALLPAGTRVYIAHIDGTQIDDMVATARAPARRGLRAHAAFPGALHPRARDAGRLDRRYQGEAGVTQGLLLAGGIADAAGRIPLLHATSGKRALSTRRASPVCMWRATPRATATSTPMAARRK
jgi:hypothetical protein